VLRQALHLTIRDGALSASPVDGIEASPHQRQQPDPFSLEDAEAIVLSEHKDNTKTNNARTVQLNSWAIAALKAQKAHPFMDRSKGGWGLLNPATGERWDDDELPREMYWRPPLKRLGMRYRSPYQTRHSYATIMLMSGFTPAYAARQLGHSASSSCAPIRSGSTVARTRSRWARSYRREYSPRISPSLERNELVFSMKTVWPARRDSNPRPAA